MFLDMSKGPTELTVGALSEQTGVNVETIRYYEREGLLPSAPRTAGGHRVFGEAHLRQLIFIRRSRELGFSGPEVRTLLGLVDGGYTCGDVRDLPSGAAAGGCAAARPGRARPHRLEGAERLDHSALVDQEVLGRTVLLPHRGDRLRDQLGRCQQPPDMERRQLLW
jgi:DNA-binding transcriptional MerR regulator